MTSRFMLIFAAVSGFIFVALGAFGAHVLSKSLGVVEMGWIQTGLEYQAFHTLAIFGLAVAMQRRISIWFYWSSVFLALGTVLFSGSLYCLALSHLRLWAFVTPVGGVSFLAGWVLMFIATLACAADEPRAARPPNVAAAPCRRCRRFIFSFLLGLGRSCGGWSGPARLSAAHASQQLGSNPRGGRRRGNTSRGRCSG